MMGYLMYLLKVSLSIMILYLLYRYLFSRFTFFVFNRFFLLGTVLLSVIIPFVEFPAHQELASSIGYTMGIDWEGIFPAGPSGIAAQPVSRNVDIMSGIVLLIVLISALKFFLRFRQIIAIRHTYRDGQPYLLDGVRCIVHPEVNGAFTLFRTVYMHPDVYRKGKAVIDHEMVHVRQWHFLDLLLSEMMCAFLWFNPFVFLLKKQMRQNHEFLADYLAQANGGGLIPYMTAMSGEIERSVHAAFASYFQSSTFKKRIIMLTDKRTHRSKRYLYFVCLPVIALLMMAFQQPPPSELSSSAVILSASADEPPTGFPMDEKYRESITADYGEMKHPFSKEMVMHKGIDIAAPEGVAIYATGDGIVLKSEYHEKYGNLIVIKHNEDYSTLFAHMASRLAEVGDQVKQGQKIAVNGSTGLSTGPHLHYEVRKSGESLDPEGFMK